MNHVAFGVADIGRTRAFYERLGFTELLFESTEFFDPMAPWYAGEPPSQHMIMLLSAQGAGIEPVVLDPEGPDCRGEWGHIGPFEFAVGVTNLEHGIAALAGLGVEASDPVTLDVGTGGVALRVVPRPRRPVRLARRATVLRSRDVVSGGRSDASRHGGIPCSPRR